MGSSSIGSWSRPRWKAKIFAGCGEHAEHKGTPSLGFKLSKEHQAAVITRKGWHMAPYVGKHGWVSVESDVVKDWSEIADCVLESYRLIAPKRSQAKLDA